MTRRTAAVLLCTAVLGLAACTSSSTTSGSGSATPSTSTSASSTAPMSSPATSTSHSSQSAAQRALDAMNLRERVGQLIMVDASTDGLSSATEHALTNDHVGSVILDGTSKAGVDAIDRLTRQVRGLAPHSVRPFVATDQEGGEVQRLQGNGFDTIASAVVQGGRSPDSLRAQAKGWGDQLRKAGVNMNLAPVLDTVPAGGGPNPPIGDLDREYGHTPSVVAAHGLAFARGMLDAGVTPVVKHFPGLGRVTGNTDLTAGVTDTVTGRNSSYLQPFRDAVRAGLPFVMMSTAIYSRLDPGTPAAFSHQIVTGLLRGTLGFRGVVISDDLGAAKQVSAVSPGQRAVRFVAAGGDIVLTVVAGQAHDMAAALVSRAKSDQAFRKLVDAAALRVLQAKQARGLLG